MAGRIEPSRNETGSTLTRGTAVYYSSRQDLDEVPGLPLLTKADASNAAKVARGVVASPISTGADGTIIVSGLVYNINTNAWAVGTRLYLSASTPGALTSTAPSAPNFIQPIAEVVVQDALIGIILVDIDPAFAVQSSAGGSDTQVQVNVAGAFGSRTGFTHDGADLSVGGNLKLATAGNGIYVAEGTDATMGVATLDATGQAIVSTAKITANTRIFLTAQASAGLTGVGAMAEPRNSRNAGSDFTIQSSAGVVDAGVDVAWLLIEPL